jgi:hypothetical protein
MPMGGIATTWRGTAGWHATQSSRRPTSFRKEAEMEAARIVGRRGGKYSAAPDPTLEEIAERCLEVQAAWSERERRNRAGLTEYLWRPQRIEFDLERQCVLESFS